MLKPFDNASSPSPFRFLVSIRAFAKLCEEQGAHIPVLEPRNDRGTVISINKVIVGLDNLASIAHSVITSFTELVKNLLLGMRVNTNRCWLVAQKREVRANAAVGFSSIDPAGDHLLSHLYSTPSLLGTPSVFLPFFLN